MKLDNKYKNVAGIYKISSGTRCYIGSSVNLLERFRLHRAHLRAGKHHSTFLQRCYNKYGEESIEFKVLETGVFSIENLRELELEYIQNNSPEFNSIDPVTYKWSEAARKKVSEIMKKGYKDGTIPPPRLGSGKLLNIYNEYGDILYSKISVSDCVRLLNISNRSVVNNTIRKGRYYLLKKYVCIPEGKDYLTTVYDWITKVSGSNIPLFQLFDTGEVKKCSSSSIQKVLHKVMESPNFMYRSKRNKSYYTFIGLINECRSIKKLIEESVGNIGEGCEANTEIN